MVFAFDYKIFIKLGRNQQLYYYENGSFSMGRNSMYALKHGKVANGFYLKEQKRNGSMEGVQSLNNKKTYVVLYDERKGRFVGRWVDTPEFAKTTSS